MRLSANRILRRVSRALPDLLPNHNRIPEIKNIVTNVATSTQEFFERKNSQRSRKGNGCPKNLDLRLIIAYLSTLDNL
jgi:hypothetical protein